MNGFKWRIYYKETMMREKNSFMEAVESAKDILSQSEIESLDIKVYHDGKEYAEGHVMTIHNKPKNN